MSQATSPILTQDFDVSMVGIDMWRSFSSGKYFNWFDFVRYHFQVFTTCVYMVNRDAHRRAYKGRSICPTLLQAVNPLSRPQDFQTRIFE